MAQGLPGVLVAAIMARVLLVKVVRAAGLVVLVDSVLLRSL
jgi:hypothetical protein